MRDLRKINPMLRSIGVIGAVAAMVTGVTFALLTSNAVAVGPNDITTGSAHLQIAKDTTTCSDTTYSDGPISGFNVSGMTSDTVVPGLNFCLKNTGDVPLNIEGFLDTNVSSKVASSFITLNVNCTTIGDGTGTLNTWFGTGVKYTPTALAPDGIATCTATISLSHSYTGSGGETIPPFNIEFQGTQV